MSIRIWLKATAEKAIETKQKMYAGNMVDAFYLDGVEVKTDETSGEKYINVYADPSDPADSMRMPRVARKHIKLVTFVTKFHKSFRLDGIYKYKNATARLEVVTHYGGGYGPNDPRYEEQYQEVSISAGSVRTLGEIYSKIRTGELEPEQNWSVDQRELEFQKAITDAEETLAEDGSTETESVH